MDKSLICLSKKLTALSLFLFAASGSLQAKEAADTFEPSWWCRGSFCQTVYGGLFRPDSAITFQRERLELPDGDFLDLDWLAKKNGAPILIILPGLGGSSRHRYVRLLADQAFQDEWNAVVMNARGTSGEPNRLKETAHGGRSADLDFAVQHILAAKHPSEIYLAGFSLGGNVLLKWLGEKGSAVPPEVKRAAAVSVPYDLTKTAEMLDRGWNQRIYTAHLLRPLKTYALEKEKRFPGILNLEKVRGADTFKIYDREVTARLNGFKDEQDYWTQSSSVHYLGQIRIPVLLVHAANDPFLPGAFIPQEKIKKLPLLTLLLTQDGGHLGFVSGGFQGRRGRWLEKALLTFLKQS